MKKPACFYDERSFRLNVLRTTRNNGQDTLQDLNYTYDAVGNITGITDNAQQTFYFNNAVIAPTGSYTYDPLYRLLTATGRELTALQMPTQEDFPNNIPCPNPGPNAMQNYTHHYQYDELGNMLQMSSQNQWTRDYIYDTATNRLLKHDPLQTFDDYTYDEHGNMLTMPHLTSISWDYLDQLHSASNGTFTSYYNYDAEGNRTRKVVVKGNITEIRYYIGNYELYQKHVNGSLDFERTTLNISDDEKVFLRIEQKTGENPVIRYQYDNHLGSACLELDELGAIISYEEYHPFGTTSYRSGRSETEVSLKRYKYCGKERDEETGLYYYGMRYYADWLCRFVSVDPLQFKYPYYTPYQYAGNKPVSYIDLDGGEEADPKTGKIQATVYFQFEEGVDFTREEQQIYINKFRKNVCEIWNTFRFGDTQVNVDEVVFELAPKGISENQLKSDQFLLTVGKGYTAKENSIPGRSYIEGKIGYMYYINEAQDAAHEFGHILGLSDRYANVMKYDANYSKEYSLSEANTVPLVLPEGEEDYNPLTNLMSANGSSITQKQLSIIFQGQKENNYSTPVILTNNPNSNDFPDAISVQGKGVNFRVTRYYINPNTGSLYKGSNAIDWVAKKGNLKKENTPKNAYFTHNPLNWKKISTRTK